MPTDLRMPFDDDHLTSHLAASAVSGDMAIGDHEVQVSEALLTQGAQILNWPLLCSGGFTYGLCTFLVLYGEDFGPSVFARFWPIIGAASVLLLIMTLFRAGRVARMTAFAGVLVVLALLFERPGDAQVAFAQAGDLISDVFLADNQAADSSARANVALNLTQGCSTPTLFYLIS